MFNVVVSVVVVVVSVVVACLGVVVMVAEVLVVKVEIEREVICTSVVEVVEVGPMQIFQPLRCTE